MSLPRSMWVAIHAQYRVFTIDCEFGVSSFLVGAKDYVTWVWEVVVVHLEGPYEGIGVV